MRVLFDLFFAFFRIGLFTFGGGYAMLPMIEREVVEKYNWCTKDDVLDIFSMSQCTPGVIAVNSATFIGNKIKGFWGAVVSTLGVILPSIIIISLIAGLIANFSHLPVVIHAFAGIRVAVAALIFNTCIKLIKSTVKTPQQIGVTLGAFLTVTFLDVSPIIIVLVCALYGLFFMGVPKKDTEEAK